jgi:hypothetical protein
VAGRSYINGIPLFTQLAATPISKVSAFILVGGRSYFKGILFSLKQPLSVLSLLECNVQGGFDLNSVICN